MESGKTIRVFLLHKESNTVTSTIEEVPESLLPKGDVTVRVIYSTLNYKDGLIIKGHGKLVRLYPHVPGVDFSGIVECSDSPLYHPGDEVILTGWRVGELRWGGYATKARVQAEWLVPMPKGLDTCQAMTLGTAGFTAMLAVMALEESGLSPKTGEVLVTGAAGGVASVAIAVLSRLGYQVVASTGRISAHGYLKSLGATRLIERTELADILNYRPMQSERWAGAIDSVGGTTLATVVTQMRHGATIAVCGNTSGNDVPLSVLPFLLRGVNLLGIASVEVPLHRRKIAWQRLACILPTQVLDSMTHIEPLNRLPSLADAILRGEVQGRVVIDVNA